MRSAFCIILFFLLINNESSYCKGLIIGADKAVNEIFHNKKAKEILSFADSISQGYDKVIIHLGRKYPFEKGLFSTDSSRRNLRLFNEKLRQNGTKIYLWFLDSYGSNSFKILYKEHQAIIHDVIFKLYAYSIYYDGLVIDMEWINHPRGRNNNKYINILNYLREKAGNKEIYVFASLIDDDKTNWKRGYDIKKIKNYANNIISMLYVADSKFCTDGFKVSPCLNDRRIDALKDYFKKNNLQVATSLASGFVYNIHNQYKFIKTITNKDSLLFENLEKKDIKESKYYFTLKYKVNNPMQINENDKKPVKLKKGDTLYYFKIKREITGINDYIWEYYYIRDYY